MKTIKTILFFLLWAIPLCTGIIVAMIFLLQLLFGHGAQGVRLD